MDLNTLKLKMDRQNRFVLFSNKNPTCFIVYLHFREAGTLQDYNFLKSGKEPEKYILIERQTYRKRVTL